MSVSTCEISGDMSFYYDDARLETLSRFSVVVTTQSNVLFTMQMHGLIMFI